MQVRLFKFITKVNYISVQIVKRTLALIALTALFILLIRAFVLESVHVESNSMQPLISKGDRLIINRLAFGLHMPGMDQPIAIWTLPERGRMVVFENPFDNGHLWLKRVIGIQGDIIHFHDHRLFLNGRIISGFEGDNHENIPGSDGFMESYRVWSSYLEEDWGPVTVPEGFIFVMGDHRGASIDSRTWGPVPTHSIRGNVLLRLWPFDSIRWFGRE